DSPCYLSSLAHSQIAFSSPSRPRSKGGWAPASILVVFVYGEAALDQPRDDEANNRCSGKCDARAVADEIAGVFDQLIRILAGDRIGDVLDGSGGAPGIIAIFSTETFLDPIGGIADHFRDVGEGFGRALETLRDEPASLV